jgi:hypothetical protein
MGHDRIRVRGHREGDHLVGDAVEALNLDTGHVGEADLGHRIGVRVHAEAERVPTSAMRDLAHSRDEAPPQLGDLARGRREAAGHADHVKRGLVYDARLHDLHAALALGERVGVEWRQR